MSDEIVPRQCGRCYFCRDLGGPWHCLRNPPELDPATGAARWPRVRPTDFCGRFRDTAPANFRRALVTDHGSGALAPNHKSQIINNKLDAPAPNHPSSIIPHQFDGLPLYRDALGDYCRIPLSQGRFAKVDPEDYPWLAQFRWSAKVEPHAIYAVRTVQVDGRSRRIYMHRQIMNTPARLLCDHINHDGSDNRKANLRNCTYSQNNANRRSSPNATSPYTGVSWDKRRQKWTAHIKKDGHETNLGSFTVEADAARAYDAAAWLRHGIYANLNFPENYPNHPANRCAAKSEARISKSETTSNTE